MREKTTNHFTNREKCCNIYTTKKLVSKQQEGTKMKKNYRIEVRHMINTNWTEWQEMDEIVSALTADDARSELDPSYIKSLAMYTDKDNLETLYDETEIRISPVEPIDTEDFCEFFVEE